MLTAFLHFLDHALQYMNQKAYYSVKGLLAHFHDMDVKGKEFTAEVNCIYYLVAECLCEYGVLMNSQ